MAEPAQTREERRDEETVVPSAAAQVREEDLEPHEGLRYVAKLFKTLALLLIFMMLAEVIIGLRQDGLSALGTLLIEATRLIVFAGFLWGAGDLAVMFIESNHDLRATRILLGRLNGRFERFLSERGTPPEPPSAAGETRPRLQRE
jgi:hypothetical protein